MKRRWLRRTLFVVIGLVLCAVIVIVAFRSWERALMETKSVRELTGIVKAKGYRKLTTQNATRVENGKYFYTDEDGREVQRYPGDEDWLIYYDVESFDPSDEPMSHRLIEYERKRIASDHHRVAIVKTKERSDEIRVGDRIFARYQRFSDTDVMIWGCESKSQDVR
jgi:hypothetical protein